MRPGQLEPNEFERAILERIAEEVPSIRPSLKDLRVLSRKYSGCGCDTEFLRKETGTKDDVGWDREVGLNVLIHMPGVPSGLGMALFCAGAQPDCLEIFTFGNEYWDGVYEGFSIDETA